MTTITSLPSVRRAALAVAALASFGLAACADRESPVAPRPVIGDAPMPTLSLSDGLGNAKLIVEVDAPVARSMVVDGDIVEGSRREFGGKDGDVFGTILVPIGSSPIINIHVFDAYGREVGGGTTQIKEVIDGVNAQVDVPLNLVESKTLMVASIGSYRNVISPRNATMLVGTTLALRSTIVDPDGLKVPLDMGRFEWSSANAAAATVDAKSNSGYVRALAAGSVQIRSCWYLQFCHTVIIKIQPDLLTAIDAGHMHTCAIRQSGSAACWGRNDYGESARSSTGANLLNGFAFKAISAGGDYSGYQSGHSCALDMGGYAFCWGANQYSQLGGAPSTGTATPQALNDGRVYVAIDAGGDHTCAIEQGGAAYCWGDNTFGELGIGSSGAGSPTPVAVGGGLLFTQITAGYGYTCGVTTTSSAYCWGYNYNGQLGASSGSSSCLAVVWQPCTTLPKLVLGGLAWSSLTATEDMGRTCGTTTSGAGYCWGYSYLGNTNGVASFTPQLVAGGHSFSRISTGYLTTCGVSGTEVWCWGANLYGELGNGTTGTLTSAYSPVQVIGGTSFVAVTNGGDHSCAIVSGGRSIMCWGYNYYGQLGDGTTTNHNSPVTETVF